MACDICGSPEIKRLYKIKNSYAGFKNVPDELIILKCMRCGFIFQKHVPAGEDLKEIYRKYTNKLRYTYLKCRPDYERGFKRKVNEILKYKSRGKLLDVGCGFGYFLNMMKIEDWEIEGIDISTPAVQYARNKFGLKIRNGFLRQAYFTDAYCDVVTAWDVIEHVINVEGLLKEIHRILRNDGLLCLETPNVGGLLFKTAHILNRITFGKADFALRELFYPLHLAYFNADTAGSLLRKCGFRIVKLCKAESDLNIILTEDRQKRYSRSKGIRFVIKLLSSISKVLKMGNKLVIYAVKK